MISYITLKVNGQVQTAKLFRTVKVAAKYVAGNTWLPDTAYFGDCKKDTHLQYQSFLPAPGNRLKVVRLLGAFMGLEALARASYCPVFAQRQADNRLKSLRFSVQLSCSSHLIRCANC